MCQFCLIAKISSPGRFQPTDFDLREWKLTLDLFSRWPAIDAPEAKTELCSKLVGNLMDAYGPQLYALVVQLESKWGDQLQKLDTFIQELETREGQAAVKHVLTGIENLLTQLDYETIITLLEELFETVFQELLTELQSLYTDQIEPALDELISALEGDFIEANFTGDAINRNILAKDIERLKSKLATNAAIIPALTKYELLDPIIALLKTSFFYTKPDALKNILAQAKGIAEKMMALGTGPGDSLNTQDERVNWYQTWLDQYEAADDNITFAQFPAALCEKWAFYSSVAGEYVSAVIQLLSIRSLETPADRPDRLGNLAQSIIHFTRANRRLKGPSGLGKRTMDADGTNWWGKTGLPCLSILGAALSGNSSRGVHIQTWGFQSGRQLAERHLINYWIDTGRNALLSYLTLRNYNGSAAEPTGNDARPANRFYTQGVQRLFTEASTWISAGVLAKSHYGIPNKETSAKSKEVLCYWFGFSGIAGLISGLVGNLFAQRIGSFLNPSQLCQGILKGGITNYLHFPLYAYLVHEGTTNGGELNRNASPLIGYANEATAPESPYRLPFAIDKTRQCIQGNNGILSHNRLHHLDLLYAYDFAIPVNAGEESKVVSMRDGILLAFREDVESETAETDYNYVRVLHRNQVEGHDLNQDLTSTYTVAEYRYAKKSSIRLAIASNLRMDRISSAEDQLLKDFYEELGVDPSRKVAISGQTFANLSQGQFIMHSGTYKSQAISKVEVVVKCFDPTAADFMSDYSIPFVFEDVPGSLISDKGVPRTGRFYVSKNPAV